MHSLKTTCVGQVFALAKPHDSLGKRTRNRIPKEERKTLVESFIKKHQSLNNGSFPSLNLTHKVVGGSFYTIREIVREIIQENRVLGTSDLVLQGKGDDYLQDHQTMSSSVLMDPVPPLSLSPEGFHSPSGKEDGGSYVLKKDMEVNGYKHYGEDVVLLAHEPVGSADVSMTQFAGEENDVKHDAGLHDRVQTVCDSFAVKPQDKELEMDKKERGSEETLFIEPNGTKHVNIDEGVNDDEAAAMMTERVSMRKNTLGTIDLPAEAVVVETFPVTSVTSSTIGSSDVQPSVVARVCEAEKGTQAKVDSDSSSTETCVDCGEISSSISAVPEEEEQETQVTGDQIPNQISVSMEKKVEEEKTVNSTSVDDVECGDTKGTVVETVHETKEFSNGSLTTERTTPTSGTEPGSLKKDIVRSEVTSVEKATVEKGKLDASDSSSSQKGNIAPLNRIKPESWKGQSNAAGGNETNPLLAALKSFLTAFVKFWSE